MGVLESTAVEAARASLAEDGRSLAALPYPADRYGRPQEVLIVADHEAEHLGAFLGRFGGPLAVRIFCAVAAAELPEDDLLAAVGFKRRAVLAEAKRMADDQFLLRREADGTVLWSSGNPSLRRFVVNRLKGKKPE